MSRTVKLSAGDVAFLRAVIADITLDVLAGDGDMERVERRERLLRLLLKLIGDRA